MTEHVLRPYQSEARAAIMREFESVRSTLLVLPTGSGKTQVFTSIAGEFLHKGRVMILAHREELVWQAQRRAQAMLGEEVDVEMGDIHVKKSFYEQARIVVSTIQTQIARGGRMQKFSPSDFSLLITDEAHHAPADSWTRCIDYYKQNPNLKVLGVTATPDRADEMALGKVYETVAYDYELPDAIKDGWLVPITQKVIEVEGLDFSHIRTTAGDLNGADLTAEMEREEILHKVATPTMELTGNRKTLVFCASVAHAERLAEIFNRHSLGCAEWICGKTPTEQRRDLVDRFRIQNFRILCNVGVATEGWDDPGVEVIVMARPTKSRSLYAQMAGRGTRPLGGLVDPFPTAEERRAAIASSAKPNMEILDFVGNSGRHHLVSAADILGGNYDDEVVERAKRNMREADGELPSDVAIALEKAQKEIDDEKKRKERMRLTARARYTVSESNPFDLFEIRPARARGWDAGKELSDAQKAVLVRQKIDITDMPYTQQRQLLNEFFKRMDQHLATANQLRTLRRFGKDAPAGMTFEEASASMNALAAERGWAPRWSARRFSTRSPRRRWS